MKPLTEQELLWSKDALTIEEAAILLSGERHSRAWQVAESELKSAIYSGELDTCIGYLTNTQPFTRTKFISMDDFKAYFQSIREKVDDAASEPVVAKPSKPIPTNNWKLKIQAEAARSWKELVKTGCSPTRYSIKDDLAKWCRDNEVTTDGGIYPKADYIYKHVLRKAIWKSPTD